MVDHIHPLRIPYDSKSSRGSPFGSTARAGSEWILSLKLNSILRVVKLPMSRRLQSEVLEWPRAPSASEASKLLYGGDGECAGVGLVFRSLA
jgi:hypothetical protein